MFALLAMVVFILALFVEGPLVEIGLALIAAHLAFGCQIPRR